MKDISIIILTHNAPEYVKETLVTLNEITESEYLDRVEIIVWDNASGKETLKVLSELKGMSYIHKIFYSKENLFFAKGNNCAVKLASSEVKYYLLLNSDVKIVDPQWLRVLLNAKKTNHYAIVSYGCCVYPNRADGYCFLIDKKLYDTYKLDETFEWWWGITKLQANILQENWNILAFKNHNSLLYHYGGKSGKSFVNAKGMDIGPKEILSWFEDSVGKVFLKRASLLGRYISLVNRYRNK